MWFSYGITAGVNLLALDFVEKGLAQHSGMPVKNGKKRSAR